MIKILTYNINGIRAVLKKGFLTWLQQTNADVIGLQEIKATADKIPVKDFEDLGYHCYFHPAKKPGYSGVAILSKQKPINIIEGIGNPKFDDEGRVIIAEFETFSFLSAYFPSGASSFERHEYKQEFLAYFFEFVKTYPKNLIIGGDLNICHQLIDIYDPVGLMQASGFLQTERKWLSYLLDLGFTDTFRMFNQEPHNYTWFSYMAGAKQRNLGWRIDYLLTNKNLIPKVKNCLILKEVNFSDHCPVMLTLKPDLSMKH